MFSYLSNMSPVILFVLSALVFFSVVSWAIIVYKLVQINRVKKNTRVFLDFFWETKEFSLVNVEIDRFKDSPLALLFKEGYRETEHFLAAGASEGEGQTIRLSADSSAIENITRSLRKISTQETDKLERNIGFLATTGSTTPFIGLFGTVWGIMIAFRNIGLAGSTSSISSRRAYPRPSSRRPSGSRSPSRRSSATTTSRARFETRSARSTTSPTIS